MASGLTTLPDDIEVRDLALRLAPSDPASVLIEHTAVTIPIPAYQRLVKAAAGRAGINATGSLSPGRLSIAVSVSLLRLTVTFEPTVSNGLLILQPRSGIPGWLIGRASPIVSRTAGLSMASDGRVTVDPSAFVPTSLRLTTGFKSFLVDADQISLTLG